MLFISVEITEDGKITGIPTEAVVYPLMISLQGETKKGKTFFAASFPNAFVLDFAPSHMKFGGGKMDEGALKRTVGEGFSSLFKPVLENGEVTWVPKIPGFDYRQQYFFVKNVNMLDIAVEKAKMFAETLPKDAGKVWLVVDDTTRWRNMEVINWLNEKKKWPIKEQFGQITQAMLARLTSWQEHFNVVLIHKMDPSYDNPGTFSAKLYPGNVDYVSDCSLEIGTVEKDGKKQRLVKVINNRHCNDCDPEYVVMIPDPDPMTVLSALRIPRIFW